MRDVWRAVVARSSEKLRGCVNYRNVYLHTACKPRLSSGGIELFFNYIPLKRAVALQQLHYRRLCAK